MMSPPKMHLLWDTNPNSSPPISPVVYLITTQSTRAPLLLGTLRVEKAITAWRPTHLHGARHTSQPAWPLRRGSRRIETPLVSTSSATRPRRPPIGAGGGESSSRDCWRKGRAYAAPNRLHLVMMRSVTLRTSMMVAGMRDLVSVSRMPVGGECDFIPKVYIYGLWMMLVLLFYIRW